MTGPARPRAVDQEARDAAVAERARNVLIDAGAGTGKTTILVDRLLEMVAPTSGAAAVPIGRLAAITFTRRAAGELRLRIRQRLLQELTLRGLDPGRQALLHEALGGLDTAYVGTIHSFADRLLRLWPMEAELSPGYEIAEDDSALGKETFEVLLHAIHTGTLAEELAGESCAARADEVSRFVLLALMAGLRAESLEREWGTRYGLDGLVAGFIGQRDVPPDDPPPDPPFDARAFHAGAAEFVRHAAAVRGSSHGARWIRAFADELHASLGVDEPFRLFRLVRPHLERQPRRDARRRDTFEDDPVAWATWKRYLGTDGQATALADEIQDPLRQWLALRLVRLFPAVVALYEKVKARRRALDQLDLLVKLRDVLRRDPGVRGQMQALFDHIFVDEFQDTDPLQAEIVLFLCEREPRAGHWSDVELRPGSLTLVGDPKQSIYRFRRADIRMYDRVRGIVARTPHLPVRLSANFRSVPPLIEWLNDRFRRILGTDATGRPFDAASGRVFHSPLDPGRTGSPAPPVQVLRLELPGGDGKADEYRALEGRALARYLRWLVEASDLEIEDPFTGQRRGVRYGDVAVLTISTFSLPPLFPALDAEGIPYASRGGALFVNDPLHRQFLLGLRGLADPDDGVAEAALLRPPFFAVDLADLARARAHEGADGDDGIARAREARAVVRELRRRRFDRPPGATARDLLEQTAFGRTVALGPNGAQRLARLRELCLILEQRAAGDGLDYDAVTAAMRQWVTEPIQLDPPHPTGTEAVQVLTVHQAKGLEFPVVVLWDGMCLWSMQVQPSAWRLDREGQGWMLALDGLAWEEPEDRGLQQTEQEYLKAERRRLVYVAATRARDVLVVPQARPAAPGRHVCGDLLHEASPALMREMETYRADALPAWAREIEPWRRREVSGGEDLERAVTARWETVATEAARPRFRPVGIAGTASPASEPDAVEQDGTALAGPAPATPRSGRFGSLFGSTVHHAIGLVVREPTLAPREAVLRAMALTGLAERTDEAAADVARALAALREAGLAPSSSVALEVEYPVAGVLQDGELAAGYADLVAVTADSLVVLDFKTDAPPEGAVGIAYPDYVAQVSAYGQLLTAAGLGAPRRLRCGLLFTGDGAIRWTA